MAERKWCNRCSARTPHTAKTCDVCHPRPARRSTQTPVLELFCALLTSETVDGMDGAYVPPDHPSRLTGENRARYRRADPQTSKDAAGGVDVTKQEQEVLRVLGSMHATAHEIADALGVPVSNISARFAPLERRGLIAQTGVKREGRREWMLVDELDGAA